MKRAAALGVIDFSTAQLLDRNWLRRITWLLEEVEIEDCKKTIELRCLQHASALNYLAGKQAFDTHWKQLNTLQDKWLNLAFPWLPKNKSNEDIMAKWKRAYKDYPDLDKRIQALSDELKAGRGQEQNSQQSTCWAK